MSWTFFVFSELRGEVIVYFVDIGGMVDHHCLEVIVYFVDIGGIVDHHCLKVIVCRFTDIGGIIDHHCLEVIVYFVDIGGIVDHHCLNFLFIITALLKFKSEINLYIYSQTFFM
jgi:hypothetical protein